MLVIFAGTGLSHQSDFGFFVAIGVDFFILSFLCFLMMFRNAFAGWYRYLIRPVLLTACTQTIVTSSIFLGTAHPHNDVTAIAIFFIIFPAILFFVILFTPARLFGAPDSTRAKARRQVRVQETPAGPASPCKRGNGPAAGHHWADASASVACNGSMSARSGPAFSGSSPGACVASVSSSTSS